MSSSVKGGGGAGKAYTGANPIVPGNADIVLPKGTSLKEALTISKVQTEQGTATPSDAEQVFTPQAGKYYDKFTVSKSPDSVKKGKYVWRKYNCAPETYETGTLKANTTVNAPAYSVSPIGVTLISDDIDLDELTVEMLNNSGFSTDYLNEQFVYDAESHFLQVDARTHTSSITVSYEDTVIKLKLIEQKLLGYVVSDDPNAYPDGGEQEGHWYVKAVDIAGAIGFSKVAIDKMVFTSDTAIKGLTINHSLEVVPKAAVIFSNLVESYASSYITGIITRRDTSGQLTAATLHSGGTSVNTTYWWSFVPSESSIICNNGENWYDTIRFKSGVEYTLITMA